MVKITRWSPDTCKCTLDYEWDDSVPQEHRIHAFKETIKRCDEHAGFKSGKDHYEHVVSENQSKNNVHSEMLKNPKLSRTRKNENGEDILELAPGISYEWSFSGKDADRRLIVKVKGAELNDQEKTALAKASGKPVDFS